MKTGMREFHGCGITLTVPEGLVSDPDVAPAIELLEDDNAKLDLLRELAHQRNALSHERIKDKFGNEMSDAEWLRSKRMKIHE
jgi:hypothetical protein